MPIRCRERGRDSRSTTSAGTASTTPAPKAPTMPASPGSYATTTSSRRRTPHGRPHTHMLQKMGLSVRLGETGNAKGAATRALDSAQDIGPPLHAALTATPGAESSPWLDRARVPTRAAPCERICPSNIREHLWSTYGAERAQPVAAGGKWGTFENRSNRPIGNRWQPTAPFRSAW